MFAGVHLLPSPKISMSSRSLSMARSIEFLQTNRNLHRTADFTKLCNYFLASLLLSFFLPHHFSGEKFGCALLSRQTRKTYFLAVRATQTFMSASPLGAMLVEHVPGALWSVRSLMFVAPPRVLRPHLRPICIDSGSVLIPRMEI